MKNNSFNILLVVVLVFSIQKVAGQATYRFPFITINPSAGSGGMGETGLATRPTVNSIFFNPSKLAFIDEGKAGLGVSYVPYIATISPDFFLMNVSLYYKVNKNQTLGYAVSYNNVGSIDITSPIASQVNFIQPAELINNLAYSIKLKKKWSISLILGFIYSDIYPATSNGIIRSQDIASVLGISTYIINNPLVIKDWKVERSLGISIMNLGVTQGGYLPTTLKIGYAVEATKTKYHRIVAALDVGKLLVPSVSINGTNTNRLQVLYTSFSDAPGGGKEELEEIFINAGIGYIYNNNFSVRAGYVLQDRNKSVGSYATLGLGFIFYFISLDLSYIINPNTAVNNSLKFSLSFRINNMLKTKLNDDVETIGL